MHYCEIVTLVIAPGSLPTSYNFHWIFTNVVLTSHPYVSVLLWIFCLRFPFSVACGTRSCKIFLMTWMSGPLIPESQLGWYQVPDSPFLPLSISICCSIFFWHSISFNKGWSNYHVFPYKSFALCFLKPKWFFLSYRCSILLAFHLLLVIPSRCSVFSLINNFKAFCIFFLSRENKL